jgi:hypothetical protein
MDYFCGAPPSASAHTIYVINRGDNILHVDKFATQQWHCLLGLNRLHPKVLETPAPIGGSDHPHRIMFL